MITASHLLRDGHNDSSTVLKFESDNYSKDSSRVVGDDFFKCGNYTLDATIEVDLSMKIIVSIVF